MGPSVRNLLFIGAVALYALAPQPAHAEIAEIGQWTFQQHLNYTLQGRTQPEFPGGLVPNEQAHEAS